MCLQSAQHPCRPDPQSRNTPPTAAGNHAKDSPKSSSTPTNTALPRHLRKSGSGSPCCLPVDPERESGRGGASGQPLPQWAFRILNVRVRPLGALLRASGSGLLVYAERTAAGSRVAAPWSTLVSARDFGAHAGSGDPGSERQHCLTVRYRLSPLCF